MAACPAAVKLLHFIEHHASTKGSPLAAAALQPACLQRYRAVHSSCLVQGLVCWPQGLLQTLVLMLGVTLEFAEPQADSLCWGCLLEAQLSMPASSTILHIA